MRLHGGALLAVLSAVALPACTESPVEPGQTPHVTEPAFALVGPAVSVDAGARHTCALGSEGTVTCWGANFFGQMNVPAETFTQVSTGSDYTCGITSDGSIVCWGINLRGQASPPSGNFHEVTTGSVHTCGLLVDATITCWGDNSAGQLNAPAGSFAHIAAGPVHTCAIRWDGSIACWGQNAAGKTTPPAGTFTQVTGGGDHTCGLRPDASILCWGRNDFGQATAATGSFTEVSAGGLHTCALRSDASVICWGSNAAGQASPPAGTFTQISAGSQHTCGVRTDGRVVCWGSDNDAQATLLAESLSRLTAGDGFSCGFRADSSIVCWGRNNFGQASAPSGNFSGVSAGSFHSCAVRADGSVACWGLNDRSQSAAPAGSFRTVSAGWSHTCALGNDDSVMCWGLNDNGQANPPSGSFRFIDAGGVWHSCGLEVDFTSLTLVVACWGDNSFGQTNVPSGSFSEVSAGDFHNCALRSDGSVACWGYNAYGQANAPAGTFRRISAGGYHTCGVRTDSSITCWGNNGQGQANAPAGLFTDVVAGTSHSCGTSTDGVTECWGSVTTTTYVPPSGPGATPPGSNVTVSPVDETTGEPAPVDLTFDNVTSGGETTVSSGTVGEGGGPPAPGGFRLGNPPTYYDVETTAVFTGSVTLCFDYSGASYGNENNLKLLHYENDAWTDVTTSLDTGNDIICGTVTSLSPFLVAEENAAPVVTGMTLPAAPVPVGTSVTVAASFTDANAGDAHTAEIDWNDDTKSAADVAESNGVGSASASHTYTAAGVYTLTATVSDGDLEGSRSSSEDQPAYVVVYDPSAGFVTGGGWFDSPPGACLWSGCAGDGSTTGRATFGFVSRYARGATVPTGNTEFQFRAGGLTFRSTSYQWLVVAAARAQYKGEGRIAGDDATYGFLVTAIDVALNGGGGADRFRVKLWNVATGAIVYDNQIDQPEDSDAATSIGGGSIVIHR